MEKVSAVNTNITITTNDVESVKKIVKALDKLGKTIQFTYQVTAETNVYWEEARPGVVNTRTLLKD